jgi:hypothetical protein
MQELVNFGQAIEALKQGKRVARNGWNGRGVFIFMRPSDDLSLEFIIHKVKSIPKNVKIYYIKEIQKGNSKLTDIVTFGHYLCMKAVDGSIINGWLASQTDILTEDWVILD